MPSSSDLDSAEDTPVTAPSDAEGEVQEEGEEEEDRPGDSEEVLEEEVGAHIQHLIMHIN